MSVGDDKRVWLKERADAARVRMDEGVKALEEENKAWVSRVDDIEVLCLSGEIKSPAKILWVKRCPYCGGGLRNLGQLHRVNHQIARKNYCDTPCKSTIHGLTSL